MFESGEREPEESESDMIGRPANWPMSTPGAGSVINLDCRKRIECYEHASDMYAKLGSRLCKTIQLPVTLYFTFPSSHILA